MKKFQPVPSTVLFHRLGRAKTKPVWTQEVAYKRDRLQLSVYKVSERTVDLLPRIGEHSALDLGLFPSGASSVHLYGKSVELAELKRIFARKPYVMALCVNKGEDPDTLRPRWVLLTCLAFASMDQINEATLRIVKQWVDHRPVRDGQRQRLYSWETSLFAVAGGKRVAEKVLNRRALEIIEHFAAPLDRIHVTNAPARSARRLGVCQSFRDDIVATTPAFVVVNIHDSTIDTLYHEMAHLLISFGFGRSHQIAAHGAEFCRVYAHLLARYAQLGSESELVNSMRAAKLKVAPPEFIQTVHDQLAQ